MWIIVDNSSEIPQKIASEKSDKLRIVINNDSKYRMGLAGQDNQEEGEECITLYA
jgi:hypothetical protein